MSGVTLAQPDITLSLDDNGIIREVTLARSIASEQVGAWRGRPWIETVDGSASGKVRRMVDDARRNGVSAYSQLTQRFPSGLELPMEFTTVRLGAKEGLLAIGRSLQAVAELQSRLIAAQQAMEQDYWKLREVETRYRMLFDTARDAVLLVRTDTLRIVEANPAAIRALGFGRGRDLIAGVLPDEQEALRAMLMRVRDQGRAPGALMHFGVDRQPWTVRATLMGGERGPLFMLQLAPVGAPATGTPPTPPAPFAIDDLLERLPDAFLVVDDDGRIRHANRGFLDLVQVGARAGVLGQPLGRWLSHPGADFAVLIATLQRHGTVRRFSTMLHGELGSEIAVEIAAALGPEQRRRSVVLLVRDIGSRGTAAPASTANAPAAAELVAMIAQPGSTSLASIVADAVSLVERHCVMQALERAGGNRTEAAEMLGVSRQSLYKKVARYELEGFAKASPSDRIE